MTKLSQESVLKQKLSAIMADNNMSDRDKQIARTALNALEEGRTFDSVLRYIAKAEEDTNNGSLVRLANEFPAETRRKTQKVMDFHDADKDRYRMNEEINNSNMATSQHFRSMADKIAAEDIYKNGGYAGRPAIKRDYIKE